MALGPVEGPRVLCVTDQDEELGVTLPSVQKSQSLQILYLSGVRTFVGKEIHPDKRCHLPRPPNQVVAGNIWAKSQTVFACCSGCGCCLYKQSRPTVEGGPSGRGGQFPETYIWDGEFIRNPCLFSHLTSCTGCKVGRPETKHCPLGNSHLNPLKPSAQDSWMGALEMGGRESPEGGGGEVGTTCVWEIRLTPGTVRGKAHQKSFISTGSQWGC